MPTNTVCHVEIQTTDLVAAQAFYEAVFEWKFRSFTPGMAVFGVGDTHIGGLMKVDAVEPGNSPSVWIEVEDVDVMLAKVELAGGRVRTPRNFVETVGWTADFVDPEGTPLGLVQFASE